jgi:hypothetical protein
MAPRSRGHRRFGNRGDLEEMAGGPHLKVVRTSRAFREVAQRTVHGLPTLSPVRKPKAPLVGRGSNNSQLVRYLPSTLIIAPVLQDNDGY